MIEHETPDHPEMVRMMEATMSAARVLVRRQDANLKLAEMEHWRLADLVTEALGFTPVRVEYQALPGTWVVYVSPGDAAELVKRERLFRASWSKTAYRIPVAADSYLEVREFLGLESKLPQPQAVAF